MKSFRSKFVLNFANVYSFAFKYGLRKVLFGKKICCCFIKIGHFFYSVPIRFFFKCSIYVCVVNIKGIKG